MKSSKRRRREEQLRRELKEAREKAKNAKGKHVQQRLHERVHDAELRLKNFLNGVTS